jgi:hypothetical protein
MVIGDKLKELREITRARGQYLLALLDQKPLVSLQFLGAHIPSFRRERVALGPAFYTRTYLHGSNFPSRILALATSRLFVALRKILVCKS